MTDVLESESIAQLMPALIKARAGFAPAVKNAENGHLKSKYVDLDGVLEAVTPALLAEKVVLMQQTYTEDGITMLLTRLVHETGEWIGSRYPVRPIKAEPQAEGSALTYARRYTAMAICGIAPEDDDGQLAIVAPKADPEAVNSAVLAFESAIADADTVQSLSQVGASIATATVPAKERADLRKLFTDRMTVLKAAA